MPNSERDMSYLWDMRKYALEITEIIKGVPHAKFVENKTIRYAIERLLLIVGEAANHISKGFQEQHPEIEWRKSSACGIFSRMNTAKSKWIRSILPQ